ncbi:HAD family hydrolase [Deinococcus peraridilitoris]|uniref:Putative phosphatase n=1 Tax=Deinococcus peraridilitoris (strain DSM 19664 / LMG 22246 / CIP 109416 / KR-200) TaxID=937777 RepID=L0A6Q1_DEIPD|nr:phosphatase [Deinococcus peraridilitoris]AFZ69558.1 putative phosphatase [Deinococcus peraridilitoris DSM 19664]
MSTQHTGVTHTHPETPRIALVFDFDDTLAPDTWDGLLNDLGINPDEFDQSEVDPLVKDGWSKIPARFYALIQASYRREEKITRERLQAYGKRLEPYPGVEDMFERIRARAAHTTPNVEVLFYVVSSGFGDIIRATRIAGRFDGIWGCDFHFAADGEIEFPKVIVEHTEKPRYLHLVEKGVEKHLKRPAYEVFRHLPEDELHVPLHQMIYVGDGSSDVACFTLLNAHHGVALGVNKPDTPVHWGADGVEAEERIDDIAAPDYAEGSELLRSLCLAVDSICARIALSAQPDRD